MIGFQDLGGVNRFLNRVLLNTREKENCHKFAVPNCVWFLKTLRETNYVPQRSPKKRKPVLGRFGNLFSFPKSINPTSNGLS